MRENKVLKKVILSRDIAIDLGTSSVLVHVQDEGIVMREPSVVAIDKNTDRVIKVGREAEEMLGRNSEDILALYPLADGVVSRYEVTLKMLRYFIHRASKKSLVAPRLMIALPTDINEVERRAILDAATEAGARKTFIVQEALAAAIGAGIPVNSPIGNMIVNIGGGTTEVSVISLGGIVVSKTIKVGGNHFDAAIVDHARENYNLLIGSRTAEMLKRHIGCVYEHKEARVEDVKGRDIESGMPKIASVSSREFLGAVMQPLTSIFDAICEVIEQTPPELVGDILHNGICFVGGGSMIFGLDKLTEKVLGIKAYIAKNPDECVILGAAKRFEIYNKVSDGVLKFEKNEKNKKQKSSKKTVVDNDGIGVV